MKDYRSIIIKGLQNDNWRELSALMGNMFLVERRFNISPQLVKEAWPEVPKDILLLLDGSSHDFHFEHQINLMTDLYLYVCDNFPEQLI